MNDRIRELRTKYIPQKTGKKLTQQEMADSLGLSQNYIWQIEKGDRTPSSRTIDDICRIYDVSRVWLETGEGEPFLPMGKEETLKSVFSDVLSGRSSEKNDFIAAIAELPDELVGPMVQSWIAAAEIMKKKLDRGS